MLETSYGLRIQFKYIQDSTEASRIYGRLRYFFVGANREREMSIFSESELEEMSQNPQSMSLSLYYGDDAEFRDKLNDFLKTEPSVIATVID